MDTMDALVAGILAGAAWIVSWGLDAIPAWHNLNSKLKQVIVLVLALVIGIVVTLVRNLPPDVLAQITPYFDVIIATVLAWAAMQGFHYKDPNREVRELKEALDDDNPRDP